MENCRLPSDLLINILARLPVRSLMRFKCVCTFFYDLIKNDHQFMHKHYEFSRVKNCGAVLELCPLGDSSSPKTTLQFYLLHKESECSETRCIYLDMPNSGVPNSVTSFVKCCQGMLCLIDGKGYLSADSIRAKTTWPGMIFDIFALNPCTREIKALPSIKVPNKPPNKPPIQYDLRIAFGFGLSNKMSWKIIMLLSFEDANWESEDCHEIVMVCSRVGDSWNWRQIDEVPHGPKYFLSHSMTNDFYLKGKYYWRCGKGDLIWFDLDDEVFGKIDVPSPSEVITDSATVMNETIALISRAHLDTEAGEGYIDIWLMDENNNDINWHKQTSIHFGFSINEFWTPIGAWNPGGKLLVLSSDLEVRYDEFAEGDVGFFKDGFGPDLICIDLVTQENKIICTSQEKKSALNIVFNPGGYVQVCGERNVNKAEEWNDINIHWYVGGYGRDFSESLYLL